MFPWLYRPLVGLFGLAIESCHDIPVSIYFIHSPTAWPLLVGRCEPILCKTKQNKTKAILKFPRKSIQTKIATYKMWSQIIPLPLSIVLGIPFCWAHSQANISSHKDDPNKAMQVLVGLIPILMLVGLIPMLLYPGVNSYAALCWLVSFPCICTHFCVVC